MRYQPLVKPVKAMNVRKRIKAISPKRRAEQPVIAKVRAEVNERDQGCRFSFLGWTNELVGACGGPLTWAHLSSHRRSRTARQAPELRHTARATFMCCQKHHDAYDRHLFDIVVGEDGTDGLMVAVPYVKGKTA